jgi:hypothetical protein
MRDANALQWLVFAGCMRVPERVKSMPGRRPDVRNSSPECMHRDILKRFTASPIIRAAKGLVLQASIVCRCCRFISLLSGAPPLQLLIRSSEAMCQTKTD